MDILQKATYRFNEIQIKIPRQFFTDLERIILNFICKNKLNFPWKNKIPMIAKAILHNKRNSRGIIFPDFKLYYNALVTKNEWSFNKNRLINGIK